MESGAVLVGRYRLTERLGQGGMGQVWAADDTQLRRRVAVKIVLAQLGGSAVIIDRLRREAENAAQLQHPGITVVHDIGEHEGHPFFVMELLDGTDFTAILAKNPRGLPVDRVLETGAAVADALAYAHRRGVVHRDIKPANLMEQAGGGVKICDFGISRSDDATGNLTATGGMLGTPAYMAPEQYEGRPADARTDLYAFGCTLYALLTGSPPFDGPTMPALMRQHLTVEAVPPSRHRPEIPAELDRIVLELLAKDPAGRPASAEDVAQRLRAVAAAPPSAHTPFPPPPPPVMAPQAPVPQYPAMPQYAPPVSVPQTPQPWPVAGAPALGVQPAMGFAQTHPPAGGPAGPPPTVPPRARTTGRRGFLIGGLVLVGGAAAGGVVLATDLLGSASPAKTLRGHTERVNAVAFSRDGRTLASGGEDGTVRLWDVAAERPVAVLNDHSEKIETVAYSPDGRILAAAGWGGAIQLWDTGTRRAIGIVSIADGQVMALVFHPNSKIIAGAGSGGATARLWNVGTRRLLGEVGNSAYSGESVAFSPDGKTLATGHGDNMVRLWQL